MPTAAWTQPHRNCGAWCAPGTRKEQRQQAAASASFISLARRRQRTSRNERLKQSTATACKASATLGAAVVAWWVRSKRLHTVWRAPAAVLRAQAAGQLPPPPPRGFAWLPCASCQSHPTRTQTCTSIPSKCSQRPGRPLAACESTMARGAAVRGPGWQRMHLAWVAALLLVASSAQAAQAAARLTRGVPTYAATAWSPFYSECRWSQWALTNSSSRIRQGELRDSRVPSPARLARSQPGLCRGSGAALGGVHRCTGLVSLPRRRA